MKCFHNQSNQSQSLFMVCILVLASSLSIAMTWYVDPVDGRDFYDGTSPFNIENTQIGPKQTIGEAAMMAGGYDILVLLDGVYSGQNNTGQMVFGDIDYKHLTVTSISGPENCIIQFTPDDSIFLSDDMPEPSPNTTFYGLTFTGNQGYLYHSVFNISYSSVDFQDCVFTQLRLNSFEPIIQIMNSSVTFTDCQFTGNQANALIGCGGELSALTCQSCTFEFNEPVFQNFNDAPFCLINISDFAYGLIDDCIIRNHTINYTSFIGIALTEQARADVQRCVIENNTCRTYSGQGYATGVHCEDAGLTINDTRIENIKAVSDYEYITGIAIGAIRPTHLLVQHCTLKNNGNGIHLANTAFPETHSVLIHSTEISGYYTESLPDIGSVGIYLGHNIQDYEIEIYNCHIHTHDTAIRAPMDPYFQSFQVKNCLIRNNLIHGIDLHHHSVESPLLFKNCTIVQNGQIGVLTDDAIISNCIIRNNNTNVDLNENVTVNYCNIEDGWPGGVGMIDVDPLFADGGQFWPEHPDYIAGTDFHIQSTAGRYVDGDPWGTWVQDEVDSPCIDAGDPAEPVANEPYGSGGRINMGTYGGTWDASKTDWCMGGIDHTGMIYGDINRDCTVDLADIAIIAENWLQTTKMTEPPIL